MQTITVNHGTLEQEAEIAATGMHDNRQNSFRFQFHHVLHNAGQDTIYDGLARDVVQGAVDGISGELEKTIDIACWPGGRRLPIGTKCVLMPDRILRLRGASVYPCIVDLRSIVCLVRVWE